MKTILLLLILFSLQANAQIQIEDSASAPKTIGKAKRGGILIAELMYKVDEDKDTSYAIIYSNAEYQTITDYKDISFGGGAEVLNQLYDVLKTFFTEENKKNKDYKKQLTLGDQDVSLHNYRIMGTTSVAIFPKTGHFYLTEKELDKLFGKD